MARRPTIALCALVLASTLTATRAIAQGDSRSAEPERIPSQELEFRQNLSPDKWSKTAEGMTACTVTAAAPDVVEQKWKTDSLSGTLMLPRDFHEAPATNPTEGDRWVGADSSSVEIHGNHALYRGDLGMGGMDIGRPLGLPTTCSLTLDGRAAPSHTLLLSRPFHGDTLRVDTPNTVVRNGVGLQIVIVTHSPAREAALLGAAQSLKIVAKP